MKLKIESDVFDIVERIKDIDSGYYIVFDTVKNKLEIHNVKEVNTYCFTSKYNTIDSRIIDEVNYSLVSNIDKIINEIDKNNQLIENYANQKIKDDSDYLLREIYKYSSNSSKEYSEDVAFSTIWR